MALYLAVALTTAKWVFAALICFLAVVFTGGLLTLILWAIAWGLEQLVDIRVGDDTLSESTKAWARVFAVCCVLFLPLGFKAASDIISSESGARERVSTGTEIRQYILVNYRPPKHVYVTIKDTATDQVYTDVYVSKHCTFGVKAGDKLNIQIEKWHYKDDPATKYINFTDLYSAICS